MSASSTAAAIGLKIEARDETAAAFDRISKHLKELKAVAGEANDLGLRRSEVDRLAKGYGKVKSGVGAVFGGAVKLAPVLGGITAVASIAGIGRLAEGWAAFGSRIDLVAQRIGMPVERLSELQTAAQLAGASAEDAEAGMTGLQRAMNAAAFGRDGAAWQAFRLAGIDVGDFAKGVGKAADALPKIAAETQRLFKVNPEAAARFLDFVGVGRQLLFVFKDGEQGLDRYNARAKELGVTTAMQADRARDLQVTYTALGIAFQQQGYVLAEKLGPSMLRILSRITDFVTNNKQGIAEFFEKIGTWIDHLSSPGVLSAFGEALTALYNTAKKLFEILEAIGNSRVVRTLVGLPDDDGKVHPPMLGPGNILEERRRETREAHARDSLTQSFRQESPWQGMPVHGSDAPLLPRLQQLSDGVAALQGVPRGFARAIFQNERGLNPDGSERISAAGAIGAGQLMPTTAAELGVNPHDLEQNVVGSIQYMRQMLDRFPNNEMAAAAAYNAGPAGRGVAHFAATGDPSQMPLETQAYVRMLAEREQKSGTENLGSGPPPAAGYEPAAAAEGGGDDKTARLRVELHHYNPPANARMVVTDVDPTIDVVGPKVMTTMPGAGTPRGY